MRILFLILWLLGRVKSDIASRPRSVLELIDFWGYEGQAHEIRTADDYILTVHRIPAEAGTAPIVFLLHGIFGTSARWTLGPPDKVVKTFVAHCQLMTLFNLIHSPWPISWPI